MRTTTIFVSILTLACAASKPQSSPPVVEFGGNYATVVSLAENTCGTISVENNPTVVTHDADSGSVTLTHAGVVYTGHVIAADSTFTTVPRVVSVGDGFTYNIAIAGRFKETAFDANASVDRTGKGDACRFVVHWVGTRS